MRGAGHAGQENGLSARYNNQVAQTESIIIIFQSEQSIRLLSSQLFAYYSLLQMQGLPCILVSRQDESLRDNDKSSDLPWSENMNTQLFQKSLFGVDNG